MVFNTKLRAFLSPIKHLLDRLEFVPPVRTSGGRVAVEEKELKSKLIGDTVNYFLSKIIPGLMGFFAVMAFVRLVGYDQYGHYAVVFATVTAFSAGVAGWLSQSILRFQSRHHEAAQADSFSRAISAGLMYSGVVGSAALGLSLWLSGNRTPAVLGVSVVLYLAMLVYTVQMTRLQAVLDSRGVVHMEAMRAVAAFLIPLVLVLASSRTHYWLLLLGVFAGYLLPVARHRLANRRSDLIRFFPLQLGRHERTFLRSMWSYGWPVALWLFIQQSMVVSDRYFIQRFWGYSAAGIYASMYDVIVRSFSLIFAPVTLAVHTALMHHWNAGNRYLTKRIISQAIKYESLLFAVAGTGLFLCRGWASRLVLGHGNLEAASIVLPLAIAGFLWQLALLAHKPLEILCQTKRMLVGATPAFLVNLTGDYVLIPRFGYQASAYVSVASALVYLMMLFVLIPAQSFEKAIVSGKERVPAIVPAEEMGV